MASDTYHEPLEVLSGDTRDMHRALVSLMEELAAIDWYQQRADACADPHLKDVLLHNKNEEIEHAMMTLEWLRRNDAVFGANAETYLFTEGEITEIEGAEGPSEPKAEGEGAEPAETKSAPRAAPTDGSLGIGSLRG